MEKVDQILKELKQIADKDLSCSLAHLAIAWSIKFKFISTTLIGARNTAQLQDCLKAVDIASKLTP